MKKLTRTMERFLTVVFIICPIFSLSGVQGSSPQISTDLNVATALVGSSVSMTCTYHEPVHWVYHTDETARVSSDNYTVAHGDNETTLYNYTTVLTLDTVDSSYIGGYRCVQLDPLEQGDVESAHIYLYVWDGETLFVKDSTASFHYTQGNGTIHIPCRVSNPRAVMTAWRSTVSGQSYDLNLTDSTWNPEIGFIFTVVGHLSADTNSYGCTATLGDIVEEKSYYFAIFYPRISSKLILEPTLTTPPGLWLAGEQKKLTCTVLTNKRILGLGFEWHFNGTEIVASDKYEMTSSRSRVYDRRQFIGNLTINVTSSSDSGLYQCESQTRGVIGFTGSDITVIDDPYINLSMEGGLEQIYQIGSNITLTFDVDAFPNLQKWTMMKDDTLITYQGLITNTSNTVQLSLSDLTSADEGNYTLVTETVRDVQQSFTAVLKIYEPAVISCELNPPPMRGSFYEYGADYLWSCSAEGKPTPTFDCSYRTATHRQQLNNLTVDTTTENTASTTIMINDVNEYMKYDCSASNTLGAFRSTAVEPTVLVFPTEIVDGYSITISTPYEYPITTLPINLTCGSPSLFYSKYVWLRVDDEDEITPVPLDTPGVGEANPTPSRWTVEESEGTFTTYSTLMIENPKMEDEGVYVCQIIRYLGEANKQGGVIYKTYNVTFNLNITEIVAPMTRVTPLSRQLELLSNVSHLVSFECEATGLPTPAISWHIKYENGNKETDKVGITYSEDNRTLTITRVAATDAGVYVCRAENEGGFNESSANLTIIEHRVFTVKQEEKVLNEDQFLIVTIGGCMIVLISILLIIIAAKKCTKTVYTKSATEILYSISTIEYGEGESYVEVTTDLRQTLTQLEFSEDNLQFDKILGQGAFGKVMKAKATGLYTCEEHTDVAVKMLKDESNEQEVRALISELLMYIHIGEHSNLIKILGVCTQGPNPKIIVEYAAFGNLRDYLHKNRVTFVSEISMRSHTADYNIDESENLSDHLKTKDLIAYSYQVANGMEFLASKKCVHRDLAARNILVFEDNLVKIADLGLARDLYNESIYKVKSKVPVRWMSPEAIFDHVYTAKSDVWSFGILLWEIFTLGGSPYPGIPDDQDVFLRLKRGYRMEQPIVSPKTMYDIMLDCWDIDPMQRPTFSFLAQRLTTVLRDSALRQSRKESVNQRVGLRRSRMESLGFCDSFDRMYDGRSDNLDPHLNYIEMESCDIGSDSMDEKDEPGNNNGVNSAPCCSNESVFMRGKFIQTADSIDQNPESCWVPMQEMGSHSAPTAPTSMGGYSIMRSPSETLSSFTPLPLQQTVFSDIPVVVVSGPCTHGVMNPELSCSLCFNYKTPSEMTRGLKFIEACDINMMDGVGNELNYRVPRTVTVSISSDESTSGYDEETCASPTPDFDYPMSPKFPLIV